MARKLREELEYTSRMVTEENRKGKKLTSDLLITLGVVGGIAAGGLAAYFFSRGKESTPKETSSTIISDTTNSTTTQPPITETTTTSTTTQPPITQPPITETTTTSTTIPDNQPPIIENIEFKDAVLKGQNQNIKVCAREENPNDYSVIKIDSNEIKLGISERKGDLVCYTGSFNPSEYYNKEGEIQAEIVLSDKFGNSVTKYIKFVVNLEPPKIINVKIDRVDLGKYKIYADVEDENLKDVILIVGNEKIPLYSENGIFSTIFETLKDIEFRILASDKFNMSSEYNGKIEFSKDNPNVYYALQNGLDKIYIYLIAPLDNDKYQDSNEKSFVDKLLRHQNILKIPTYFKYTENITSDGLITDEELESFDKFTNLVEELYNFIGQVGTLNLIKTVDYSSNLGLKMGFDKEIAKWATVKAIGYYGIAVVDKGLPENFDEIYLLTKATQIDKYGDKLVDFSPIVFYSVDGENFVLIPDAGIETWMLAKHMKLISDSGFDILKHPEMFEGLNGKIIANAYSIFDANYGINYIEQTLNRRTLKPTDKDVWDLIMLQWNLYSNKAPQLGGGNKLYNRDFPWYDSDKLDALYQDANTRRQALLFLFYLDNATFDMEKGKKVFGIEGAKTALIQAEKEYEAISKLYPDGKIGIWKEDPRYYYYGWLMDRQNHGLSNTVYQYIGVKIDEYKTWPEFIQLANQRSAIDQYITKNWKYWDLVKFAMGYERWARGGSVKGMDELDTINFTIPQTLKAFGFPVVNVYIEPTPLGASPYEWAITLPDYIVNNLKNTFSEKKILIGPGNIFSLYLCKEGLEKDGIKEVYIWLRNYNKIYLMKK